VQLARTVIEALLLVNDGSAISRIAPARIVESTATGAVREVAQCMIAQCPVSGQFSGGRYLQGKRGTMKHGTAENFAVKVTGQLAG
jgi:hypothetical protein